MTNLTLDRLERYFGVETRSQRVQRMIRMGFEKLSGRGTYRHYFGSELGYRPVKNQR